MTRSASADRYLLFVAFLVALLLVPSVGGSYATMVFTTAAIYAMVGIGLDLLFGIAGQLSLGHAAFFAIGAYTSGILATRLGVPFLLSLSAGGIFAAAVGGLVAIPALRLTGLYLGMATLAIGIATPDLIARLPSDWAGGIAGMAVISKVTIGPFPLNESSYYYFVLLVAVLLALLARNLMRSSLGRTLCSIRDNALVAEAVGVDVTRYKTLVFAISGFYAGIAGALQAHLTGFLSYEQFNLWMSITFLSIVVIGGAGTVVGPVLGALFMVVVPEVLRDVGAGYATILTGIIMVMVLMLVPEGLVRLGGTEGGLPKRLRMVRERLAVCIRGT